MTAVDRHQQDHKSRLNTHARWLAEDGLLDGVSEAVRAAAQDPAFTPADHQRMRDALVVFSGWRS